MRATHTTITHHYEGDGPVSQAPGCAALMFDVACFVFFLMIVGFFLWMQ